MDKNDLENTITGCVWIFCVAVGLALLAALGFFLLIWVGFAIAGYCG